MKININPKKELFKWGSIDFKVIYGSFFIEVILTQATTHSPWPWPPCLVVFNQGKIICALEDLELQKTGLKYFKKYFLNLKQYKQHWDKWQDWVEEYKQLAQQLEQTNFKKLDDKELYKGFKEFYDFNIKFWLIVHIPEIANWGGEYLLKNKLKHLDSQKFNEYLEILSTPVKLSFFQSEELDLLKIYFIKNPKEKQTAFKDHAAKYNWILNSYGGNRILKPNYFKARLKKLTHSKGVLSQINNIKNLIKNNKKRKTTLVKRLKLDQEIVLIADQLSEAIWWQDLRKGYIWRMQYYLDQFLNEISRRTNWTFHELQWCLPNDLLNLIKNKRANKKQILYREKYYALYAKDGICKAFTDKKKIQQLLDNYINVNTDLNKKEIKGLIVSKGNKSKIVGQVKIIHNPFKENKKFNPGDILVAGMTSPEFIIIMKKAKAIITDHGGMTSHAAIVSRELKVPCIVGTKISTKLLKDGDKVEIDINNGIIKII